MWQSPSFKSNTCGYGSLLSQGRRVVVHSTGTPSRSRGAMRPSLAANFPPSHQRAQGMPGARSARSRAWSVVNTRVSHHGHTGSPGIPRAMVLTVSFVLSPVTGLVCHRHRRSLLRRLERQRRGVRTTRLRRPLSRCSSPAPKRPPHPAPYVRDDRETPLRGHETAWDMRLIWVKRETKNFCEGGWTGPSPNGPSGKSPGTIAIVVPANAGTHTPCRLLWDSLFDDCALPLTPVVMGPCVRRDDALRVRSTSAAGTTR
jgi:hypothetical protein